MKPFGLPTDFLKKDIFSLRAEALSVDDFIQLTVDIEELRKS